MPASPSARRRPHFARLLPFLFLIAVAFLLSPAPLARAQATPAADLPNQNARAVSGPYDITVVTRVKRPTAGLGSRITVRVLDAKIQQPLEGDLDIVFIGVRPDGTTAGRVEFPQFVAFPEFYEYPITFNKAGAWRYTIAVESAHGLGTVDGEVEVVEPPGTGEGGAAVWGAVIVILIVGAFLLYRSNSRRAKSSP